MNSRDFTPKSGKGLSARRLVLLGTTILSLGAAAFLVAPDGTRHAAFAQNVSEQAQSVARPVGFADIVEKVKPAVIAVRVKVDRSGAELSSDENPFPPGSPFERFFRRFGSPDGMPGQRGPRGRNFSTGQGSGFFISADGYAVTNNHVVDKAETVEVQTDDGKNYKAKVIGTDPRTDLALIKVDGEGASFPFAKMSDKLPRIGDWVLAVGNPFGLSSTVTAGIVSARGRDIGSGPYDDFLQIDAPVNKGNSGGPTFDIDGHVVGVNTAIFSPSGGNVGIAFAIPASTVQKVIAQLKDHGEVSRGWIGVQIQPVTKDIADSMGLKKAEGALVAEPQDDSPAMKAGIKSGDVITSVNGDPVKDARELARKIGNMAPNTSIKLAIIRDGKEKDLTLTLGELPNRREANLRSGDDNDGSSDREMQRFGLKLAPASKVAGASADGVVVTDLDPRGLAADVGFKTGDVILEVGGKTVSAPGEVKKALADARKDGKRTVLMRVKSGQGMRFVALPLGRA